MALEHTGFGTTTEHEPKPVGLLGSVRDDVLATIVAEPTRTGAPSRGFNVDDLHGDGSESIPFCQRRARRQPVNGWAVARITDDQGERLMMGVRYVDSCPGGLGLESTAPVAPGSEIILHFHGQSDPSRFGVVRWCRADAGEQKTWRVGVECITPVAAA